MALNSANLYPACPDGAKIPFLFLTGAYISQDDEEFALKSGGAIFTTVSLPLYRISKSDDETSRPEQSQPVSDASGVRILNFDDEPGILDILYSAFQQDGYIVHRTLRGEHGIDYINKNYLRCYIT
ncbi:MAG: hypothetical protein QF879_17725 [Candidatus Latescibacteria bacterium]|nr:hypothetical protein [Candidatus Latescibacterota bacterium]